MNTAILREIKQERENLYIGLQDDGNGSFLPLYNDPVTGTTFSLRPGESIEEALARKRAEFVEVFNGRR